MKYQVYTKLCGGIGGEMTEQFNNSQRAWEAYEAHLGSPNTVGGYIANRHGVYQAYGSHANAARISYEEWLDA